MNCPGICWYYCFRNDAKFEFCILALEVDFAFDVFEAVLVFEVRLQFGVIYGLEVFERIRTHKTCCRRSATPPRGR